MDSWIDHLLFDNPHSLFYLLDVRISASSQFQMLAALCRTSHNIVPEALSTFTENKIVMPTAVSPLQLGIQVGLLVDDTKNNLVAEQQRKNLLIRTLNEQMQLPTALLTNYLYTNYLYSILFVSSIV